MTKAPILTFIYIYYTALASYTINLVEQGTQNFLIFAQISFYAIPCAFILLFYYKKNIKPRDEEMYGQNV